MKAIVVHQYGGPEVLKFEDYPDPVPGPGEAGRDGSILTATSIIGTDFIGRWARIHSLRSFSALR